MISKSACQGQHPHLTAFASAPRPGKCCRPPPFRGRYDGGIRSDRCRELGHLRSARNGDRARLSHEPRPQHRRRRDRGLHRLSGGPRASSTACPSGPASSGTAPAVALGFAIFWLAIRRVMGEPPFVGLMLTVGVATILNGVMIVVFGGGMVGIPTGLPAFTTIGPRRLPTPDVIAVIGVGSPLRRSCSSTASLIWVCRCGRWPNA